MLRVGFLSSQNYWSRSTFSGTLFAMYAALSRRRLQVVPLGHPAAPGFRERMRRRFGLGGPLSSGDHNFDARARAFVDDVKAQLRRDPCDVVFAPVASLELFHSDWQIPVVYASDTTFRLYRDTFDLRLTPHEEHMRHLMEHRAVSQASRLLYPSPWAAQSAVSDYGASGERIDIAEFGANMDVPSRAQLAGRRRSDRCVLLFVARQFWRKGGDVALASLAVLRRRGVDARMVVVGSELPRGLSVPGVDVIPYLDKNDPSDARRLYQLYLGANFLIFPTRADCSPIALCEAAAFGLPVIAAAVGGIPSLVVHGKNGYLLPGTASAEDYAARIAEIWTTPDAYEQLGRQSRIEHERRLNWDTWAARAEQSLREAAFGSKGVRSPSLGQRDPRRPRLAAGASAG
jgi:glycosyltransferase involved in cell wall biosynthesis